jgi:diguanylate cyclase
VDANQVFDGAEGLDLARATIDQLSQLNLSTAPPHYELWAMYLSGAMPALEKEIDGRLAAGASPASLTEELFERYFGSTRLSVEIIRATETITRELTEVATSLRNAGADTSVYSEALEQAVQSIEAGDDRASIHQVLSHLAAATREMAVKNRQLSAQMAASSRQVETLQSTLQTVKLEALTDGLTGLANRKYFDQSLRRAIETGPGEVCLLLCDIDHFKRFNDSWGHLVGDQIIRFIANVLRAHADGDALAARYGGEEFAVIMPRTLLCNAARVGHAINTAVKSKKLTRRSTNEVLGLVTISIGIARHRAGEGPTELVGRADAQLYAAKREGRDRVNIEVDNADLAA